VPDAGKSKSNHLTILFDLLILQNPLGRDRYAAEPLLTSVSAELL
jgi:hypothetical protein